MGSRTRKGMGRSEKLHILSPVLQFHDPLKPITLSSDVSKNGLGAVIMQLHNEEYKPVAYAASAMLDAEIRHAKIEKELLSIVFACERFHQFVYGTCVEAELIRNH